MRFNRSASGAFVALGKMAGIENEFELAAPPTDGITALRFLDDASLLASSWDASVRVYNARTNELRAQHTLPAPILDCDWLAASSAAGAATSGALDGRVRLHDLSSSGHASQARDLGAHSAAVRCVRSFAGAPSACLVSGSWDRSIKVWDVRAADACVGTYAQPDKVISLCVGTGGPSGASAGSATPLLVVATAGRQLALIDLRSPAEALQRRESSLKCATRCVAQMPGGEGFTIGSVEGRVAVEYVDPSAEAQQRRYAFKCHRALVGGVDTAFPVNTIVFHPRYGTFATGGCDGNVYVWDGAKKKRLCSLRRYPTSVAALAFSPSGESLAVGASYTYEHGDQPHPPDAIFVRRIAEAEVRPKGSDPKA